VLRFRSIIVALCVAFAAAAQSPQPAQLPSIDTYIHQSWDTLQRSMMDCKSLVDPKLTTAPVLYLPTGEDVPPDVKAMESTCRVDVRSPPRVIHRIARKFMQTVRKGYEHDGTIREKYNMDTGSSDVNVTTGYKTNVVGFGWTNGVYREMEGLLTKNSAAAN